MRTVLRATMAVGAALLIAACGSAAAGPSATPRQSTPRPTPTPTAPVPGGPFAVVVTNAQRQGATYQVKLVDVSGKVVAGATASLPTLKANQTIAPPLVSASHDLVYYLDGDTEIHSLAPSGLTTTVTSVPEGAQDIVTFAVSPDDQRIAVAVIAQASDSNKDSGHAYVADLHGGANRSTLWNNSGSSSLRWPVGWHGDQLVDDIDDCGQSGGYGYVPAAACSYHVVDATSARRIATLCEVAPNTTSYYSVDGVPTAGGTACEENESTDRSCTPGATTTYTVTAVDWAGSEHDFLTKKLANCGNDQFPVNDCFLAPDGQTMACRDSTSQALTMLRSNGSLRNLGHKYDVLGWIDAAHLLVDLDSSTLGVLGVDGTQPSVPFEHADNAEMDGTLPGGL
jgi:hypothetical protein